MSEWWETFFAGLWEQAQVGNGSEDDNRVAADKLERALELQSGAEILDVPCGDGRISIEFAARGYAVTGAELNQAFLAVAARKAEDRGVSVTWLRHDMRDLPFDSRFDAAINVGGSFGYFDDAGDARTAAGLHRALRSGGRLLMDVASAETIFPRYRERVWSSVDGILVLNENRYDHETGRNETDWTLLGADGTREHRHSSMRLYTYHELAGLLTDVGFTSVDGFDAEDLGRFRIGASRLIVVATK